MCERPIGVFDSGLGGLTVVRELSRVLPGEDILYLGDTARVPYGGKSPQTVQRFVREIVTFLLACQPQPKLLVVACNTATAAALDLVRDLSPVEVVDVIGPGAASAIEAAAGPIGVIATESTIASGAYTAAIERIAPGRRVVGQACPLLVPIVEEGFSEHDPIVKAVLCKYLRELQRLLPVRSFGQGAADNVAGALILGCTHYPLLEDAIATLMGPSVPLVSSAKSAAAETQRRLALRDLLSHRGYGGRLTCFTTDNPDRFRRLGERFGGRTIDVVEQVTIDETETR